MAGRLLEIAKQVGVSEATVSRVLNGRSGVSEHTRQAVLAAVDVLGYERPTKLKSNRGRMVGLIVPEISNPIFAAFAEEISVRLSNEGLGTVLCVNTPAGGSFSEHDYIQLMLDRHVSGVIFGGGRYQDSATRSNIYDPLIERQIPVVLLNAHGSGLPFPSVTSDDAVAGAIAWRHLVQLGHERIGLVLGHTGHLPSERKLAAIRRLAAKAGKTIPDSMIQWADYTMESGQSAGGQLFRQGATAVIAASDPLAVGALRAAERMGLSVPDDVSVIGYDDSPMMAHTRPALTTVRQPVAKMAEAAVNGLMRLMSGAEVPLREQQFDPELLVRDSTGVCQVRKR